LSALSGSLTIGQSIYGSHEYNSNSTCFGSTIRNFNSDGEFLYINDKMKSFTHTDLPDHVAHATSKCGILSNVLVIIEPSICFHKVKFVSDLFILS